MRRRKALTDRLYLRGTTFWVWGYDSDGKRWAESTHQTSRAAALQAAREIEKRRAVPADRSEAAEKANTLTLSEALEFVIDHDIRQGNQPKTIRFHRDKSRHLVRLLERETLVTEFIKNGPAMTIDYMDKRLAEGAHRHTIQKEIRVLIQAMHCAKEKNLYAGDPSKLKPRALKKKKNFYTPVTRWLSTEAQAQALIDQMSTGPQVHVDRKGHVGAYLSVGVRKEELYLILPEHVNLKARTAWVDGTKTDGSARTVHLNTTARAIFKEKLKIAKPGKPIFEHWASADRDLRAAYERARETAAKALRIRIEELTDWPDDLSFNDLRRTFCSLMATRGVPMQHCAKLLGHKSLDMVMEVYSRLTPESLQAAVDTLPTFKHRRECRRR